jgi:hypothetical protein
MAGFLAIIAMYYTKDRESWELGLGAGSHLFGPASWWSPLHYLDLDTQGPFQTPWWDILRIIGGLFNYGRVSVNSD